MKKDLYEQFCSDNNLKLAYRYLKYEFERSTLKTDPLWYPAVQAIDKNEPVYFDALSKLLFSGRYNPQKPENVFTIKDNLAHRRVAVLNLTDRIVYQAIVNRNMLGGILNKNISAFCYSPRLSESGCLYFKDYKTSWDSFKEAQIKASRKGYIWTINFDIADFFDNIDISKLLDVLINFCGIGNNPLLDILKEQLETWTYKPSFGIPQGPEASSILSNVYLSYLDNKIKDYLEDRVVVFRYQDDYVIQGESEQDVYKVSEQIVSELMSLNLSINSKTRVSKTNVEELKYEKFDPQYGNTDKTVSKEHFFEIRPKIPEIIKKYKEERFDDITKQDISDLKYFLKVPTVPKIDFVLDLISILPRIQFLISEATQFIYRVNLVYSDDVIIEALYDIWSRNHFFYLPKLWVAKLILSYESSGSEYSNKKLISKIQQSVADELTKSGEWLSVDIGLYYLATRGFDVSKDILIRLNSPSNEFDTVLLISCLGIISNDEKILNSLRRFYETPSCDVNIVTYTFAGNIKNKSSYFYSDFSKLLMGEGCSKSIDDKYLIKNNKKDFRFGDFTGLERSSDRYLYPCFFLDSAQRRIFYFDRDGKRSVWNEVSLDSNYYKLLRFFVDKGIDNYFTRKKIEKEASLNFNSREKSVSDMTKAFNNIFNNEIGKKFNIKPSDVYHLNKNSIGLKIPVHLITDFIENE